MTISLKQKISFSIIALIATVGIVSYVNTTYTSKPSSGLEMRYIADFSDDRNVIGFAGNVFAGKITKVLKDTKSDNLPVTLYEVEVIHNIKGGLKGNVVVMDIIGYSVDDQGKEKLTSLNGVDTLMQPGEIYLFATNYDEVMTKQEGLDIFSLGGHPNFNKKLSVDGSLTVDELRVAAKQNKEVRVWEAAYANENIEMQKFIEVKTINNQ